MSTPTVDRRGVLFGPFLRIVERSECEVPIDSMYDGHFAEFYTPHSWTQTWDLPVYSAVCAETGARSVVEVGCGSGRIVRHLLAECRVERVLGIDISATAGSEFRARVTDPRAEFRLQDVLAEDEPQERFDLAILGNFTINAFVTDDTATAVLRFLKASLRPGGRVVAMAPGADLVERFAARPRVVDAVPFVDASGVRRLIWRGVDFDPARRSLLHNYFIEGRDGERIAHPGVLGVLVERLWTDDEVAELAGRVGLRVLARRTLSVAGDGGHGATAVALVLVDG